MKSEQTFNLDNKEGKNMKNLKKIFFNKHFLIPFFSNILIIFAINVGLIFNLPNYCNIFPSAIERLSATINNTTSLVLFTTQITIFIVFFSIIQLSFSRNILPANIIRRYIIEDKFTIEYLGFQLSFGLILAYFSFFLRISKLNVIMTLFIILISIFLSVLYFLKLVRKISKSEMFGIILSKLEINEIDKREETLNKRLEVFNNKLNNKYDVDFKMKKAVYSFRFLNSEPIFTDREGIIENINLQKINDILKSYKNCITEVVIEINIGQQIPINETLPDIISRTVLLRVINKKPTTDNEQQIEKLNKKLREDKFHKQIVDCFIIEKDINVFKHNKRIIHDLVLLLFQTIDNAELDNLLNKLFVFIYQNLNKEKEWYKAIGFSENLFIEFLKEIKNEIRYKDINKIEYHTILEILYSFKNLAFEHKSIKLLNSIINLELELFYTVLMKTNNYISELSSEILNLKELSLSNITFNNVSKEEINESWDAFYSPLIIHTINSVIISLNSLIKYFHRRNEKDNQYIILSNTETLINLLDPFSLSDDIDSDKRDKLVEYFAMNIAHLAINIYKVVIEDKLPNWLITKIAFPLITQCHTINKYPFGSSDDLLTDFYFDYRFNNPLSEPISSEFEINKIHEAGTYTPVFYSFSNFWITYSIYRKMRNLVNIPNMLEDTKNSYSKEVIERTLLSLEIINIESISLILNISDDDFESYKNSYKEHLQSLLKNE